MALRLLLAVTDPMSLGFLRGRMAAAARAGFDVSVICGPGPHVRARIEAEGARAVEIPMARAMAPGHDTRALAALIRALRRLRPDIVDAGTPKAGLLVLLAARLTGVPCRVHTLHGLRDDTVAGLPGRLVTAATRLTCALAQRVVCVSPSLRERAVARGLVPEHNAVVLGAGSANGIDLDRFAPTDLGRQAARRLRRRLGITPDAPVLGFVGRLSVDKGVPTLAAAWVRLRAEHPDLHLVLVGPDDATDPVPTQVRRAFERDPRVHSLGWVDDPVPAYLAMDLLALPTRREGFGYALLEAAALGLPVVATRVTGCVDAVEDGVTGTLVAPDDVAAISAAISAYLADPDLRARHGRAGRARAERLFRQDELWDRLHALYRDLARRAGRTDR
ncbi:glycosyltransferase family 4 protein [Haliangium sp.]|uniref:glycosyltransferase family 4 protein n=1 Tax=Haliangium sp. TaxID=2663208 RepID=UPI003D11AEAB